MGLAKDFLREKDMWSKRESVKQNYYQQMHMRNWEKEILLVDDVGKGEEEMAFGHTTVWDKRLLNMNLWFERSFTMEYDQNTNLEWFFSSNSAWKWPAGHWIGSARAVIVFMKLQKTRESPPVLKPQFFFIEWHHMNLLLNKLVLSQAHF